MLQHFFFQDDVVKQAWKIIDDNIGYFIEKKYNLLMLSDHGCDKIERIFNINKWLHDNKYLILKQQLTNTPNNKLINNIMYTIKANKKLKNLVSYFLPQNIKKRVTLFQQEVKGVLKYEMFDWKRSVAFASAQGPIYLNPSCSAYHEGLRDEIADALQKIEDSETGKCPIKRVYKKEEIFNGPYTDNAPDLMAEANDGYFINGSIGKSSVFDAPDLWKAENTRYGMFVMYGKDVAPGPKPENNIVDIVPTLLHWLNVPIPNDMDGEVLKAFFSPLSKTGMRPIEYAQGSEDDTDSRTLSAADEEIIRQQLINLGYME
jgi:predicted AlkP superfamily phosphohydrolase/phosphomutase